MFNNYSMTPEYKMNYNVQKAFMKSYFGQTRIYKLQIHHSRWERSDRPWKCNRRKLYQTENEYTALVYYRENIDRYDRNRERKRKLYKHRQLKNFWELTKTNSIFCKFVNNTKFIHFIWFSNNKRHKNISID
jgi:hypothetical protein